MRKSYTYNAAVPANRNEFIDMVKEKRDAIVITHSLLIDLNEELDKTVKDQKKSKRLKMFGYGTLLFFNLWNPLTWIVGVGSILLGGKLKDDIKNYVIYTGTDVYEKRILVLHSKKIDLKYDKVEYDPMVVRRVSKEPAKGKIKL